MSRYSQNIPSLGEEEVRLIEECLVEDASRRKSFVPEDALLIMVDDSECGALDPYKKRKHRLDVDQNNKWIEIHAQTKKGVLLLATHLYRYDDVLTDGRKRKYSTRLEGGQKIIFTTYLATNDEGDKAPVVDISYHETKIPRALSLFWRRLKNALSELRKKLIDQPMPMLAFIRAIQARRLAYPLALASLIIAVALPAWYKWNSSREETSGSIHTTQRTDNNSDAKVKPRKGVALLGEKSDLTLAEDKAPVPPSDPAAATPLSLAKAPRNRISQPSFKSTRADRQLASRIDSSSNFSSTNLANFEGVAPLSLSLYPARAKKYALMSESIRRAVALSAGSTSIEILNAGKKLFPRNSEGFAYTTNTTFSTYIKVSECLGSQ